MKIHQWRDFVDPSPNFFAFADTAHAGKNFFCEKKNYFRGISHTCVEIVSIAVIKEEFTC
ncbi:hypothetical protein [Lysinibacillus sp. NPDC056232]|uniref:hypothetical protein n=1 Tax=Lysinibacillus sp. NPDC056232 TaxID=3345756 RepID=UPI0035E1B6E3